MNCDQWAERVTESHTHLSGALSLAANEHAPAALLLQ
jgi:hypothetical protein